MRTNLLGLYFVESDAGHKTYRIGQIVGEMCQGLYYLISFDTDPGADNPGVVPMEVISIQNLNAVCPNCNERMWDLFETKNDRDKYVTLNSHEGDGAPPPMAPTDTTPIPGRLN